MPTNGPALSPQESDLRKRAADVLRKTLVPIESWGVWTQNHDRAQGLKYEVNKMIWELEHPAD